MQFIKGHSLTKMSFKFEFSLHLNRIRSHQNKRQNSVCWLLRQRVQNSLLKFAHCLYVALIRIYSVIVVTCSPKMFLQISLPLSCCMAGGRSYTRLWSSCKYAHLPTLDIVDDVRVRFQLAPCWAVDLSSADKYWLEYVAAMFALCTTIMSAIIDN